MTTLTSPTIAEQRAAWKQTQLDGLAVLAYLTDQPDHEATPVMVTGGLNGDEPGTVIPGTPTLEHGFPRVTVRFHDGSVFSFHAARVAPYTPIRYTDNDTVLCANCQP